jgi:tetratricopeptide (TPR) repeat protein
MLRRLRRPGFQLNIVTDSPKRSRANRWLGAAVIIALVLGTVALYSPVRTFEFLNFDDTSYVTENPKVLRGISWRMLTWAVSSREASNWHPLTWLSHALDCQLFGQNAGAHHLVSLALHAANAVLLLLVLRRLTGSLWRSALVAALFAWHPLHVESVAWVAERKDVLSAFFGLLTLWAYTNYCDGKREPLPNSKSEPPIPGGSRIPHPASRSQLHYYILALLFFTLGLMSKPMLVTFPCLLLLLDYWPLRRLQFDHAAAQGSIPMVQGQRLKNLCVEKLPFFALAAVSSIVTYWAQELGGSVATAENLPIHFRVTNALIAYATYLGKMLWPADLACFYPLHPNWPVWQIGLSAGVLLGVSAFVFRSWRRAPYLVVGWLWFLGMLVPVIGLVQVGTQALADRYAYLPLIGVFIALVWGTGELLTGWHVPKPVMAAIAGLTLLICAASTHFQLRYWKNSEALFSRAVAVSPQAAICHLNLGNARLVKGRCEEAIPEFQTALRLSPTYALAHVNWGNALRLQGNLEGALGHFAEALLLQTNYPEVHYVCGNILTLQGHFPEAEAHYLQALSQKKEYPQVYNNLGNLYELEGHADLAFSKYNQAVALDPDFAEGHYYLGGALARQKKLEEAVAHFTAAVKLDPNYALALNDLAWILATAESPELRDLSAALHFSQRACAVTNQRDVNCLDTLAWIYSEAGQFAQAAQTATQAASLARAAGRTDLADSLTTRSKAYEQGHTVKNLPQPLPQTQISPTNSPTQKD